MPINTPTAPAPKIDQERAREIADTLLRSKLEVAANVADYRKGVQDVLTQVKGADDIEKEVKKVAENMDAQKMAHEHGDVKIDDLGDGVKGVNVGLSDDATIDTEQLTAEKLIKDPEDVAETLSHEGSEEDGHPGQTNDVRAVIDADGNLKDKKVLLEGEVEANQGKKFRGNASAARADQPKDGVYDAGQEFISRHHEAARAYIRKDGEHAGDAVRFQAEVLKGSSLTPEEIEQKLTEQTDFTRGEILDIIVTAKAEQPEEKAKAPDHAMAA